MSHYEKLYIVPLNVAQGYGFHTTESHYIVLPDGVNALMRCVFHNANQVEGFENIHGVADGALPHPAYEPHAPIADHHADKLAHLGVQRGDTTYSVSKKAAAQSRTLRIW
jgi:hypothetical protein